MHGCLQDRCVFMTWNGSGVDAAAVEHFAQTGAQGWVSKDKDTSVQQLSARSPGCAILFLLRVRSRHGLTVTSFLASVGKGAATISPCHAHLPDIMKAKKQPFECSRLHAAFANPSGDLDKLATEHASKVDLFNAIAELTKKI